MNNIDPKELLARLSAATKELETLRAGYTVVCQLVETYRMTHDTTIDWNELPQETLCMAHQDIGVLRAQLASATKRAEDAERDAADQRTRCSAYLTAVEVTKARADALETDVKRMWATIGAIHWNAGRKDIDQVVGASIVHECERLYRSLPRSCPRHL